MSKLLCECVNLTYIAHNEYQLSILSTLYRKFTKHSHSLTLLLVCLPPQCSMAHVHVPAGRQRPRLDLPSGPANALLRVMGALPDAARGLGPAATAVPEVTFLHLLADRILVLNSLRLPLILPLNIYVCIFIYILSIGLWVCCWWWPFPPVLMWLPSRWSSVCRSTTTGTSL